MKIPPLPLTALCIKAVAQDVQPPSPWHVIRARGEDNDRLRYAALNDRSEPWVGAWNVCMSRHGDR